MKRALGSHDTRKEKEDSFESCIGGGKEQQKEMTTFQVSRTRKSNSHRWYRGVPKLVLRDEATSKWGGSCRTNMAVCRRNLKGEIGFPSWKEMPGKAQSCVRKETEARS